MNKTLEELDRKELEDLTVSVIVYAFRSWFKGFMSGMVFMGVVTLITFACLKS